MSFLSWFTSAPKVVDASIGLVEKAASGIDMLVFTEEERAQMSVETMQLWLQMQDRLASESSIRSLTRRIIAVSIVSVFLLFLVGAGAVFPANVGWAKYLLGLAESMKELTLLVAFFYFGYYGVSQVIKEKNK